MARKADFLQPSFEFLRQHRAHDYRFLVKRWRAVARASGLVMRAYAEAGGHPLYWLRSRKLPEHGAVYLSAGIHGDEPAGTEGCLAWAEKNLRQLAEFPFVIFPCLNPWGLSNNIRLDEERRDLNRNFQNDEITSLQAWRRLIQPYRFSLALMLHEDYDAQGVYLYEAQRVQPHWGEGLLAAAGQILPIEGRTRVDGRKFQNGVFRRRLDKKLFEKMGLPESPYLSLHHADRTFTIETPSEFALDLRVRAHVAIIEEGVRRVFKGEPPAA